MTRRDLWITLLIVVIWGINFIALKWSATEVPPFLLTGIRYLGAALPAVFFIRPPKVSLRFLIFYGMVVGTCQFSFIFMAIRLGMPAGLASLVMQTQVFFTFAFAVWVLGERPRLMQILGCLVAFVGIAVISLDRLEGAALLPLLLTIGAAVSWGASNIITKKAGDVDMMALVVWGSLVPPIPVFILSLIFEGPMALPDSLANLTLRGGISILFSAYLSTLFAYGLWSILLKKYPANTVAPFTLLVPIFGIGSSVLILGETVTGNEVWGCALVFLGLILNVFGPRLMARYRAQREAAS